MLIRITFMKGSQINIYIGSAIGLASEEWLGGEISQMHIQTGSVDEHIFPIWQRRSNHDHKIADF